MDQHDVDEERQRRIDAASAARDQGSVPWFMSEGFIRGVFIAFGVAGLIGAALKAASWSMALFAVSFTVLFFGGFAAVVLGIVNLQERFTGVTCEAERAWNQRHNRQGYACLIGGGLAWIVVVIMWLMVR